MSPAIGGAMMPDRRILRACVALFMVMVALTAAQSLLERISAARLPATIDAPTTELLASLPVGAESDRAGYQRDRFGSGWSTGDDGCDTRSQVLRLESTSPTVIDGCAVLAGDWVSVYDGARVTDPSQLDIDHLVPLAEAWTSGASTWTDGQRQAFANDLHGADALIAVTASSNRAKGDSDPAEWLPPDPAVTCWYATAWITQKAAWRLSVDPDEHQALTAALGTCPEATR